jgi:hypothetical protein
MGFGNAGWRDILRLPLLAAAQAPALYDPDLQKNLWQRIAEWFD